MKIFCSEIRKTERFEILDEQIGFFMTIKSIYNYSLFGPYYLNIRIIFSHQNLTEYRFEYHYSEPNYSKIQIIRTIRSDSGEHCCWSYNKKCNIGRKKQFHLIFLHIHDNFPNKIYLWKLVCKGCSAILISYYEKLFNYSSLVQSLQSLRIFSRYFS